MKQKREAFTLIEMVIAITVFVIFIGFVMAAYLTFHRSQTQVAATRSMLLEGEAIFNRLGDLMDDHKINFEYYNTESEFGTDASYTLEVQDLVLISLDEEEVVHVYWEESEEDEDEGNLFYELDGEDPIQLNALGTSVDFMSFRIFPDDNPYSIENQSDPDFPHFQAHIQVKMTLGRVANSDDVILDLQTTLTSRFYQ
ncbi:MAG: prepilin-type N-terminal cleavage/methylation domain-containing protein [Oceanicoccus sp.]|jgi:prepilin-type N-terminal cleavage/methylation domain-containing protein